jgi:hypothetical protein
LNEVEAGVLKELVVLCPYRAFQAIPFRVVLTILLTTGLLCRFFVCF